MIVLKLTGNPRFPGRGHNKFIALYRVSPGEFALGKTIYTDTVFEWGQTTADRERYYHIHAVGREGDVIVVHARYA